VRAAVQQPALAGAEGGEAVDAREARAGDVEAQAMAAAHGVGDVPELDVEADRLAGRVETAPHALGDVERTPVGRHVHERRHDVGALPGGRRPELGPRRPRQHEVRRRRIAGEAEDVVAPIAWALVEAAQA